MELFAAISAGDEDAVRELLERRPELAGARDEAGLSPVRRALERGEDGLVEAILDANPPLDVFDAAAAGRTRGLAALLDDEPELVRARSPDGMTPLHLAARYDRRDAVELLLERGADRAAPDGAGATPADVAGEETRDLFAPGG